MRSASKHLSLDVLNPTRSKPNLVGGREAWRNMKKKLSTTLKIEDKSNSDEDTDSG